MFGIKLLSNYVRYPYPVHERGFSNMGIVKIPLYFCTFSGRRKQDSKGIWLGFFYCDDHYAKALRINIPDSPRTFSFLARINASY